MRQAIGRRVVAAVVTAALLTLGLSGCGGGGGGSSPAPDPAPPAPPPPPPPPTVGMDVRPSNTSCVAPERTFASSGYALQDAFPNLPNLPTPMKLIQPRNDSAEWYALGRNGSIDRFAAGAGADSVERYLNIAVTATGEGGLLSGVFHPDWPVVKEIFVSYTIDSGGFESRLSRLVITDDATLPATYTEQVLLTINQPFSNHNGGDVAIGPDGYLYLGIGDGGDRADPHDNGQNTTTLLGNILRLDVSTCRFQRPATTSRPATRSPATRNAGRAPTRPPVPRSSPGDSAIPGA
jgi:glucose/arabinose dehydrogenase